MKHSKALQSNEEFREIYRTGKSYANKYLVMYARKNDIGYNRIGISVSKKVGNSVIRHRITRLIRESYRLSEDSFLSGLDIVVVARVGARGRDYSEIECALLHLKKLHKIGNEHVTSDRI
jgi:ribonuclease P protein component